MALVQTEHVFVVPTELFHRLGYFQGFSPNPEHYMEELLNPENTSYRPRTEMEDDPSYKQLIPYVIFRFRDDNGEHVFRYTRGTGQGEERLHCKRSIGVGGHISTVDLDVAGEINPYDEGMHRELNEEVIIETAYRDTCVGLINDDQTEVGRVHLGVVHVFDLQQPAVRPRESDLVEAGFSLAKNLCEDLNGFESWSQICLQALFVH